MTSQVQKLLPQNATGRNTDYIDCLDMEKLAQRRHSSATAFGVRRGECLGELFRGPSQQPRSDGVVGYHVSLTH